MRKNGDPSGKYTYPVPLIVSFPFSSSVHVALSPHVPDLVCALAVKLNSFVSVPLGRAAAPDNTIQMQVRNEMILFFIMILLCAVSKLAASFFCLRHSYLS